MFDKNNNKWIIYWVVNLGFCKFLLLLLSSSTLTIFSVYFSTFPLGLNNTKVFALVIMVKVWQRQFNLILLCCGYKDLLYLRLLSPATFQFKTKGKAKPREMSSSGVMSVYSEFSPSFLLCLKLNFFQLQYTFLLKEKFCVYLIVINLRRIIMISLSFLLEKEVNLFNKPALFSFFSSFLVRHQEKLVAPYYKMHELFRCCMKKEKTMQERWKKSVESNWDH